MDYYFYWINLDKDSNRRQYMEKIFSEYNIRNIRIPAILGAPLKIDKELACTQSHLKAIQTFLSSTEEIGIICEDDLSFDYKPYWKNNIDDVINNAPKDWGIIQLGIILTKLHDDFNKYESKYVPHQIKKYYSTICYVINRASAEKFLNVKLTTDKKINYVADHFLYSHVTTYTYKYPLFTYRDNNDSTIHPEHLDLHIRSKNLLLNFINR